MWPEKLKPFNSSSFSFPGSPSAQLLILVQWNIERGERGCRSKLWSLKHYIRAGTYLIRASVYRPSISISFPDESFALEKSNVDSTETIVAHTDASAEWRPGHTLEGAISIFRLAIRRERIYRRPNPNVSIVSSSLSWPSAVKNLSGWKNSGFGYFVSSRVIALWELSIKEDSEGRIKFPCSPYITHDRYSCVDQESVTERRWSRYIPPFGMK